MSETIVPLDLGCVPEAAVSGAILFESEGTTFLLFNAMVAREDRYVAVGRAVVEFEHCWMTKFGYPNDEARFGIPRFRDLGYDIYEVLNSEWDAECTRLNRFSFPDTPDSSRRHFLFSFHDSTFECLAEDLSIEISTRPTSEILAGLAERVIR